MFRFNSRKGLAVLAVAVLALMVLITPTAAAPSAGNGFRALSGAEAAAFELPNDVELVTNFQLANQGLSYERYQQKYGQSAADVLGGQLTLYRSASGQIVAVIGSHYPELSATNRVNLTAAEARQRAVDNGAGVGERTVELMIDPGSGRYFYSVETRRFDSRWFYWIDAQNGNMVNSYNALAHGEGTGVGGDTKDLTGLTTQKGNGFEMVSADGRQTTYDAGNRNRLPGALATDSDDLWHADNQAALVDAHFYARVTDNYFSTTHTFNWTDFYSQGMVSSAHYKRNYNNAFWNGSQMVYGDGDGFSFVELSGDLDVVGHELSHGVTEATSNLIYQNESGALNEAFSDIMGTAVEYSYGSGNWTIGEDITPAANGIRNMADPNEDGDPSHYADRYTGSSDSGGVHSNSGIANHWFYLLVNGGQNANPIRASGQDVAGIGLAAAEQVAFLGFTALPANASFCNARDATIAMAGSQPANVADAWDEVGVDEALCNGGSGGPGGGDGPVISNVSSSKLRGRSFEITWTTDVPATSVVTFTCCGEYSNSSLVTNHRMTFNGAKGVTYEYFVTSADASGASTMEGPFVHQN